MFCCSASWDVLRLFWRNLGVRGRHSPCPGLAFGSFLWCHFCLPTLLATSQRHSWNSSSFSLGWWVTALHASDDTLHCPALLFLLLCAGFTGRTGKNSECKQSGHCQMTQDFFPFFFKLKALLSWWIVNEFFLVEQFSIILYRLFFFLYYKTIETDFLIQEVFTWSLSENKINKWPFFIFNDKLFLSLVVRQITLITNKGGDHFYYHSWTLVDLKVLLFISKSSKIGSKCHS